MSSYSAYDLSEAQRAIESALHKSEKALLKLKQGAFWHTLTSRGIAAYQIALELLKAASEPDGSAERQAGGYSNEDLINAANFFTEVTGRVVKIFPKFVEGTPQHTLAVRRIKAFEIAKELILKQTKE